MNLTTLITDLAEIINLDTSDSTILSNIKRWINTSYKDFQSRNNWYWLKRTGKFQTVEIYEDGTADVTQNSRAVTGSGTNWTSAMVGRYFRVEGKTDWYKIIAVGSTTSLTLDVPYLDSSASAQSYKIWQKHYELYPDIKNENLISVLTDGHPHQLVFFPYEDAGFVNAFAYFQGNPHRVFLHEWDKSIRTYTTGTVSGTVDTKTLTGSSTVWLDNVMPGDRITVGNYNYYVLSVDSNTQLTLTTNLMATISAETSYTRTRENNLLVMIDFTPKDPAKNMTYTYYKKTYDMQNDNDLPEIPEMWHYIVVLGAKWLAYQSLDDPREALAKQIFEIEIAKVIRETTASSHRPSVWLRYDTGEYS